MCFVLEEKITYLAQYNMKPMISHGLLSSSRSPRANYRRGWITSVSKGVSPDTGAFNTHPLSIWVLEINGGFRGEGDTQDNHRIHIIKLFTKLQYDIRHVFAALDTAACISIAKSRA